MLITGASVDWKLFYDNAPQFSIVVDQIPDRDDLVYQEKNGIYYAEKDGYVSFLYYDKPGNGYGGQHFDLHMQSGETKTLIGPWSSRAGAVNSVGFGPCLDVSLAIADNRKPYESLTKYTFYSGHITLDLALQAAKLANCQLVIDLEQNNVNSNASGQQKEAIDGNKEHYYHVIDENYPRDSLLKSLIKNSKEATFYPYLEERCVCSVCKCIRIGDKFVKNKLPCRNCSTIEDFKRYYAEGLLQ